MFSFKSIDQNILDLSRPTDLDRFINQFFREPASEGHISMFPFAIGDCSKENEKKAFLEFKNKLYQVLISGVRTNPLVERMLRVVCYKNVSEELYCEFNSKYGAKGSEYVQGLLIEFAVKVCEAPETLRIIEGFYDENGEPLSKKSLPKEAPKKTFSYLLRSNRVNKRSSNELEEIETRETSFQRRR